MKKLATIAATTALFAMSAMPAFAKPMNPHTEGQAGNSNMAHHNLVMHENGPEGAWGRVTHNLSGETFDFTLNAHGLEPNTEYVIKSKGHELGSGTTDENGNLNVVGSWECNGVSLNGGRINVRRKIGNVWTLWTGNDTINSGLFTCE